jgi:hypothetical protein
VITPPEMRPRLKELRLEIAEFIGWDSYTIGKATLSFAISVTSPVDYVDLDSGTVAASDIYLVCGYFMGRVAPAIRCI